MKTKKVLQTLVSLAAMLALICGSLPAVYADTAASAQEMPSYRASEYFSTSTNPLSIDGRAPWRWEYYDSYDTTLKETAKYTIIGTATSNVHSSKFSSTTNYPHPSDDTTGAGLRRAATYGAIVGKYWMGAEMENSVIGQYYAVRTFVAPAGGTVTITADNQNSGKANSIEGTSYTSAMVKETENRGVRIVLERTDGSTETIWPTADTTGVYTYTDKNSTSRNFMKVPHGSQDPLLFEAIGNVQLKQGEKLHFELANLDPKENASGTEMSKYGAAVYWDPVVSYNSIDSAAVMPAYRASEAFVPTKENNNPAPWGWESYDTETSTYALLGGGLKTGNIINADNCPITADIDSHNRLVRDGNVDASAGVGKYWMNTNWTSTTNAVKYYAVRTFTAPESGNITITAPGINGAASGLIYGLSRSESGNSGKIRLMLEDNGAVSQLWPESDWQYVPAKGTVSFEPMTLNISQGQKLHFEMADSSASGSTGWNQAVCWDPQISYNSSIGVEPFDKTSLMPDHEFAVTFTEALTEALTAEDITVTGESATVKSVSVSNGGKTVNFSFNGLDFGAEYAVVMKDPAQTDVLKNLYQFTFTTSQGPGSYRASEVFVAAAGYNHPDPWRWEYYDTTTSTYKLLEGGVNTTKYSTASYSITTTIDSSGYAFKRDGSDNASTAVGKYWMSSDMYVKASALLYYAVRTFTAPETGNITITAAGIGELTSGLIYGSLKSSSGNAGKIRITLEDNGSVSQIWPESDWQYVPASGNVSFAPMTLNIKQGQKLHFEMTDSTAEGSTAYNQAVCWDPQIAYNPSLVAFGEDVTFSSGTDFSSVVNSGAAVTVTIPAIACYTTVNSVTPIAAVYNEEGILVSYSIGDPAALAMNKLTDLTVSLPPVTGTKPADGYIKVFLWDLSEGLTPLSDIGSAPVIGTAVGNTAAAYAGTGEAG